MWWERNAVTRLPTTLVTNIYVVRIVQRQLKWCHITSTYFNTKKAQNILFTKTALCLNVKATLIVQLESIVAKWDISSSVQGNTEANAMVPLK